MSVAFRPRISAAVAIALCGATQAGAQEGLPRVPSPGPTMPGSGSVDDPALGSLTGSNTSKDLSPALIKEMRQGLLQEARAVEEPSQRALALARIALLQAFNENYDEAKQAVAEAAQAVDQIEDRVFHDLRGAAVIRAQLDLAQSVGRKAFQPLGFLEAADAPKADAEAPDRAQLLSIMEEAGHEAAALAGRLKSPTQRNELRLAVANALSADASDVFKNLSPEKGQPKLSEEDAKELGNVADRLNLLAIETAKAIEQPNWRDRALVQVAANAASGQQYERAVEVARSIPAADIRYEALGRIADGMARGDKGAEATKIFQECAQAIATIPNDDPRNIAVGYLLQVLVSLGRFDDAKATAEMYNDPVLKRLGLGAVAESMGRRGLGKEAREWIKTIQDNDIQSYLTRRIADGEIYAIRQSQAQAMFMDLPFGNEPTEEAPTEPLR
jgi:hypothetical protein